MRPNELAEQWPRIENNLQVGDIILIRARRQWLAKMIQRKTHSYWNHAALVFIPSKDLPFTGPLLIEAIGYGIEIHQMKRYTTQFDKYDIGVKRYPGITKADRREFVRDFMLENIDVPYDYSRIVGMFVRDLFLKYFDLKFFLNAAKYFVNEDAFVCSTFAHKAFMQYEEKKFDHDDQLKKKYEELYHKELYAPGDIAKNDIFRWVFNERYYT